MKDYQSVIEALKDKKEITTKELKELGYSPYDIKSFVSAGIISRTQKGIYNLSTQEAAPVLEEVESPQELAPVQGTTQPEGIQPEESQQQDLQQNINHIGTGINYIIKKDYVSARKVFNSQLDITPNSSRVLYGIFATYIYEEKYENAYEVLVASIAAGIEDVVVPNYYISLELLKEYIEVDEDLVEDLLHRLSQVKTSKMGSNTKKMIKALQNKDYPNVFRFINYNISFDIKGRKYRLTNQVIRKLCENILRKKGLYQEKSERLQQRQSDMLPVEEKLGTEEIVPEEQVIVVPEIKEENLLPTLLIEAINKNDYETALSILESSNIENPKEVIKILLEKLRLIKSLLTTTEPLKVVKTETAIVVEKNNLLVVDGEPRDELPPPVEQRQDNPKGNSKGAEPILSQKTILAESTLTTGVITDNQPISQPTEETPVKSPADIAYKAYKDSFWSEDFDEALKNLRRYDYIMATNGQKRNLTYHYKRIEECKKDYETNPENYIQKRDLAARIFELKVAKKHDEALALIEAYKGLPGYKSLNVIICEAEIYYAKGDYSGTRLVLNSIPTCEEPTYYFLLAHLDAKLNRLDDALKSCFAYNERRPRATIGIYTLMGDIYKRKGKAGKAAKTYRIAKEIGEETGKNVASLTAKISGAEAQAETKRELRLGYKY